jgi:DNA-binding NarL/FixJ family response regulator
MLHPDFDVEELDDGRGATELLTSVGHFDAAVVEMRAAGSNGVPSGTSTIRDLRRAEPTLGVVAFGGPTERHAVREALDAGATAYVSKRSDPSALRDAVEAVCAEEAFVDPAAGGSRSSSTVTRRQREVLQLFANGLSTQQAAKRLGISQETVRTHAKASLSRLGARDRTHAVAMAVRGSIIE